MKQHRVIIGRVWFALLLTAALLMLALGGCQPKAQPTAAAKAATAQVGPKAAPTSASAPKSASAPTAVPPTKAAPTVAPTSASAPTAASAPTVAAPAIAAAPTPAPDCAVSTHGLLPQGEPPVPAVRPSDHVLGPADAFITITEYADVQCPPCSSVAPILRELQAKYPQDVRLVFRHFPLDSIHPLARLAAQSAEAAGEQGKFWEMLELLYAHQKDWSSKPEAEFKAYAAEQAAGLGLDRAKFEAALVSEKAVTAVRDGLQEAVNLGLRGTPSLAVNGFSYGGNWDLWTLSAIVDLLKLEQRAYKSCPAMVIDPAKSYEATLKTSQGDIVIELLPKQAPLSVNNFVFLAREGWYDGVPFHRVIAGFMAQTGDPTGTGGGGPGYALRDEVSPSDNFDATGLVAMANAGPNTNGSQFFITYGPQPTLNGKHTIFGRVTAGMDVADKLTVRDPSQQGGVAIVPDKIVSVTITEK